jgi:hypothetical protein
MSTLKIKHTHKHTQISLPVKDYNQQKTDIHDATGYEPAILVVKTSLILIF